MNECIFCQIIKGELPAKFVYKDEDMVVFKDISPQAPVHILVVPKKHIASVREVVEEDRPLLGKMFLVVRKIGEKMGIANPGYKLIINNGKAAGQLVDHLHIHVLGGWKKKEKWKV